MQGAGGYASAITGQYYESAASTNVRTYSVRVGETTGANCVVNDGFGGGKFGAAEKCNLVVTEILP